MGWERQSSSISPIRRTVPYAKARDFNDCSQQAVLLLVDVALSAKHISGSARTGFWLLLNLDIQLLHLLLDLGVFARERCLESLGDHALGGLTSVRLEPLRHLRGMHASAYHAID